MADCLGLICVVSGETYRRYARQLFVSAEQYLRPGCEVRTVMLLGREGWPAATLYRHHVVLEHLGELRCRWLFLCDADMLFAEVVDGEILDSLVATRHPGYVGQLARDLPYERRPESAACVQPHEGSVYYAGGFVGGEREAFLDLSERIAAQIDADDSHGIVACWHDESHLNSVLAVTPPTRTLSPAYCYPDEDAYYRRIWLEQYPRKLVALDKSPAERRGR